MIFVHLYNDSSGSPRVLSSVIDSLSDRDEKNVLFLGSSGNGLLGKLDIPKVRFFYPRFSNKYIVLFFFIISQIILFFSLIFSSKTRGQDIVYVNTVLPFGAALYAKFSRKRLIYHIHECGLSPPILFKVLLWISDTLSDQQIYVSQTHKHIVNSSCNEQFVLNNCVSKTIYNHSQSNDYLSSDKFTILMSASLREYKGVDIFVKLAEYFSDKPISWLLLLNEDYNIVREFSDNLTHIEQISVFSRVQNPSEFYQKSHLVLNLSLVDQWTETFGLTLIEAFSFGLPVIAPPIGGPTEIVNDGVNGFLVNSYDFNLLTQKINFFYDSPVHYTNFSNNALLSSYKYTPSVFKSSLKSIVDN